jgi:hypothetical protein
LWNFFVYFFHSFYTEFFFESSFSTVYELDITNVSNLSANCNIVNLEAHFILNLADLLNGFVVPFMIMSYSSAFIIFSIYLLRKKSAKEKNFKKLFCDLQISITIIFLNLAFVSFNIPVIVYNYVPLANQSNEDVMLINILFYFQYIFDIFVYLLFYPQFRKELFKLTLEKVVKSMLFKRIFKKENFKLNFLKKFI